MTVPQSQPGHAFRSRWRRWSRRLAWTGMGMLALFLFGRHLLLSWVVAPVAGVTFGTPVGMGEASFVPTRRLDLSDLRIGDPEDAFLTVGPVEARYRLWRSLLVGPCVERLHAEGLKVNLAQTPRGKVRSLRFRWLRRFRQKEDIEDTEAFLLQDISLRQGTIVYEREDSPFHLRIENVEATLAELREGTTGRIESQGDVAEVAYGPLRLVSGKLQGYCELRYDREMNLQGSEFSFVAENLAGTFGGVELDNLCLLLSGSTEYVRGRGNEQDVHVTLSHQGQRLGSVSLVGYYTKNLAMLDLTARVDVEAELFNWLLAGWSLPSLDAPRFELAARGHFPRPGEAEVSLATNLELGGETVADLDFSTRSPLPPVFRPARFRVTGERLDLARLLAAYRDLHPGGREVAAEPSETPADQSEQAECAPLSRLAMPPAVLDLDLRGVSYGEIEGTLTGNATVRGQTAEVTASRLQLGEGTLDLAGMLDWATEIYQANVQGRSLDLAPFARQFLTGDGERMEGRLESLSAEVSGRGLSEPDWDSLEGTFQIEMAGLELYQLEVLRDAARKAKLEGLSDLRFDRASLVGRVTGGTMCLAPFVMQGPSGRAELAGQIRLADESLDLTLAAGLGPELAKCLWRSSYSYLAFLLRPRDGYLYLPTLPLRGTVSRPRLDMERLLPKAPVPL